MSKTRVINLLAHWQTVTPVPISPLQFYSSIEDELEQQKLPGVDVSRVWWQQGSWLSERRQYLRVRRKSLAFDICGISLGNSTQVSWWLNELAPGPMALFFEIPGLGPLLERVITPVTFYQVDTSVHFQRTVHETILRVIDVLNKPQGIRKLSDQPIMREFYEW